jgi:mevalonate pyrophosphate decarboxylase
MSDPKKIKAKEFFTIELDHQTNNITLYVNGEIRNKIHTVKAESLFDRMLKIAKQKFLKMREQIEQ